MGEFDNPDGGLGGTDPGNIDPQGGHPAWNEVLQVVPTELHEKVTPLLQKWDQGVNERFQKVQSQYEPWKQYVEAGVDPNQVQMALNVLNTLQDNPEYVWKTLGDYHKFGQEPNPGAGGQGQVEPEEPGNPLAKNYNQLEENFNKLAEFVVTKEQAAREAQEDAALDRELADLRQKFGDYDERYVLSYMETGMSGEDAVKQFKQLEQRLAQQGPKPLFLGGNSGGVPGTNTDVRKLDDKGARNFAIQMLQAHAAQRNQ